MTHCLHCPGPDDPRHHDPVFAADEAACAFYEDPANRTVAGPGRKRRRTVPVLNLRYEPPEHGPQTVTLSSACAYP